MITIKIRREDAVTLVHTLTKQGMGPVSLLSNDGSTVTANLNRQQLDIVLNTIVDVEFIKE